MKKLVAVLAVAAMLPMAVQAEGMAVTGKVGTLGAGLELSKSYSDALGARLGFNAFSFNKTGNQGTVSYNGTLQLQTFTAIADWYPFHGAFRTSAGLFYNNNKFTLNAQPVGGTITINGVPQTMTSLTSDVSFNKVAPYLGIGWGNAAAQGKGWGLNSDLGILFQGAPKVTMTQTGGNAAAQAAVAQEQARLESSLSNFKMWPVASVGISYQW